MRTSSYRELKATVLRLVEAGRIEPQGDRGAVRQAIAAVVAEYQERAHLEDQLTPLGDPRAMVDRLFASVVDLGPLTELLARDDIEEIQVQGTKVMYWTSDGRVHWPAPTATEDELRQYVERLLLSSTEQVHLDASNPIVSTGIGNGSRLSVKIAPVVDELTVSIRKQVARRPTLRQLVDGDTLTAAAAGLLFALMQTHSKILVAGPPAAGKTTLVNALLAAAPPYHVVRVNEETRELTAELTLGGYAHANDRPGQTLRDLIKADLRFRPDLLVVGEVRGGEAYDLLRPLNAGAGLLTTVHANQAAEAVDALASAAELAGERVSGETLRTQFSRQVEFVIFVDADDTHVSGEPVRRRQVMEIAWIDRSKRSGDVVHTPLFSREELGLPLEWTDAALAREVTRQIEKDLARRTGEHIPLKPVLSGDLLIGGVR